MYLYNKRAFPIGKLPLILAVLGMIFSAATPSFAQFNASIFGPNVYVFDPSVPGATINTTLDAISNPSVSQAQFSTNRYAVLFKPGQYTGVSHQVGFYLSVAGLGTTPDATVLSGGGLYIDVGDSSGNVTTNFWRSIENLKIPVPTGGTERWAVAQGAAFRRMHVAGSLELTDGSCHFASGGFISDSVIDTNENMCSQQQWYTRNSVIGSSTTPVWNYVFSGVTGAPAQNFPNITTLATTPVSREKPYLYIDSTGNYSVFSPALQTASSGVTWTSGGLGVGTSLSISTFFIATPSNTVAQINTALASGKNLILTPGIYSLTAPINVTAANTVVLGLGYPTLVPQNGNAAMTVADVGGVQLAGLLIDAGPTNSAVLLQVGVPNTTRANHANNPTSISDVFFRIGGATAGSATTSLEVDSNNIILDNIWAWRADHGTGVGWTTNPAAHGLVVNGDNVTALGLAVEHYQQSQVQWNGNNGETIFYQSEDPYDVPSQGAWMDGSMNGYPSYEVTSAVCNHTAYGLGIYSFFNQGVAIFQDNAISTPNSTGMHFTDMVTVKLNGSGGINNVINGQGGATPTGASPKDFASFVGTAACSAGPLTVAIDSGGGGATPFVADTDFSNGSTFTTTQPINITNVSNPAPVAVYQSQRQGQFNYTIPGFTPNSAHIVRLHFAELYFSTAGSRIFNVAINGTQVLHNFDVVATAGAFRTANIQQFNATANGLGQIVITLTDGTRDQPLINGVEIQ
ncbi:malectin domain-containing carbohydrate-binding protein [Terriglobus saanensis]|uniref:Malectin domain-containing protein n=1 Tax=Terriglobus saanensis (strain ATCC BAA-1853 / DSM 23119 / SP1PR4) TaxID=401053 RepID=E8V438_TERSS|nr:malectin domain-containing carbohydrate-binding protein [Terriglobus saanensis]ADV82529.1 hypothetical protein AciPR4_1722 [Terriglobus saanensis SP1PR4]